MSCVTGTFRKVGSMTASFQRQGCGCSFSAVKVGSMTASFGLVCTTSLGDEYILWGREGIIYNVYGDKIYLTRK